MSDRTPRQDFALEEYASLRREIDGQEEILDRLFKRALLIISICYLILVSNAVPFVDDPIVVPKEIKQILQALPPIVAIAIWINYSLRYNHLKILAGYIENLEREFYDVGDGVTLGWERYLRESEATSPIRRNRHHLTWLLMTLICLGLSCQFSIAAPSS